MRLEAVGAVERGTRSTSAADVARRVAVDRGLRRSVH